METYTNHVTISLSMMVEEKFFPIWLLFLQGLSCISIAKIRNEVVFISNLQEMAQGFIYFGDRPKEGHSGFFVVVIIFVYFSGQNALHFWL